MLLANAIDKSEYKIFFSNIAEFYLHVQKNLQTHWDYLAAVYYTSWVGFGHSNSKTHGRLFSKFNGQWNNCLQTLHFYLVPKLQKSIKTKTLQTFAIICMKIQTIEKICK